MPDTHRFCATIEAAAGGGTVARIPADLITPLGGQKQMRMLAKLNGVEFRTSTMPHRGAFFVGHSVNRDVEWRRSVLPRSRPPDRAQLVSDSACNAHDRAEMST